MAEKDTVQGNPQSVPSKRRGSDATAAASKSSEGSAKVVHFTARNPPWTYLKLQMYESLSNITSPFYSLQFVLNYFLAEYSNQALQPQCKTACLTH